MTAVSVVLSILLAKYLKTRCKSVDVKILQHQPSNTMNEKLYKISNDRKKLFEILVLLKLTFKFNIYY